MKINQIIAAATIVCLAVAISNAKAISADNTINLGQSTNILENYSTFIQSEKQILQVSESNLFNSKCKIKQRSISEDWINLLGKLIILGSFSSVGVMSNSVVIQRYIELIFKDILPIFLIIFLSFSLLGIASVIASTSFSSSLNSQNTCIFK